MTSIHRRCKITKWNRERMPKRMYSWLRLALADLECMRVRKDVEVNMFNWVNLRTDGHCSVCLAGAVLARHTDVLSRLAERLPKHGSCTTYGGFIRLEYDNSEVELGVLTSNISPKLNRIVQMLDCLRRGDVSNAVSFFYPSDWVKSGQALRLDFSAAGYHSDSNEWWKQMRNLVETLEELDW